MSEEFTPEPQAWRFNPDGFYADNYAQSTARLGIGIDYREDDYDRHLAQFLRDLEAHDDVIRASAADASMGEPSDAQVRAAREAWLSARISGKSHLHAMRAALRAAGRGA